MDTKKFIVRGYVESDRNFIFSSWLNGLLHGTKSTSPESVIDENKNPVSPDLVKFIYKKKINWFEEMSHDVFYKGYHKVIERILAHPETKVKVACLQDVEDVILGYAILGPEMLHWVFVKESWRQMGIAKAIVAGDIITKCTHLTKQGKFFRHKYKLVFDPFF